MKVKQNLHDIAWKDPDGEQLTRLLIRSSGFEFNWRPS